jgi:hypothetical protein
MLRIAQSFKDAKKTDRIVTNRFEEKDSFEAALDRLIASLSAKSSARSISSSTGSAAGGSSAGFKMHGPTFGSSAS